MKRGFTGFMMAAVGVVIAVIILFSVVQPITNTLIATTNNGSSPGNLTGYTTALTVSQQLPVFIGLTALVVLASLAISAFRD